MPSSHLILCHPLLLLPPVPPSIRVFSNESTLRMRWPKYWSFSFSIRTPLWFSNSIYGKISEGNENTKANIHLIPMFITLLTTTAKLWKHPVFISRWNDKKEVVFIHTREYYKKKEAKKKKEGILAICDNVDGPWGHYDKWSQAEKDKYCMISLACGILK